MDEILKLFGGAEQLWTYIQRYAGTAGKEATRIVLESYYVVRSPETPVWDKTIIIAALAYQLLPTDLLPKDKFGVLGILDNGAAMALAYNRVKTHLTPQIESQVSAILNQWYSSDSRSQSILSPCNKQNPMTSSADDWINQTQTVKASPNFDNHITPNEHLSQSDEDDDVVID